MLLIYLLLILVLFFIPSKIQLSGINEDYIGVDSCNVIKGVFILIVFMSHSLSYITPVTASELLCKAVMNWIGQLMVAMFLFYSGYGVYLSIQKKEGYVASIPKKRVGMTLLHFDIAVVSYALLKLVLKMPFSAKSFVLSLVGWDSIGNSNWYIFGILALYLITYIAFSIFKKNKELALILVWFLSLCFIYGMSRFKDTYWFDTILCYPFGMTFGYLKPYIEKLLKNNIFYMVSLVLSIALFFIFRKFSYLHYLVFSFEAMLFCVVTILATMKIKLSNPILIWFGKNLFWVYILQRLPMITLKQLGVTHTALFFGISFVITIILTLIYLKVIKKLDQLILNSW